jgi:hypothetical protein
VGIQLIRALDAIEAQHWLARASARGLLPDSALRGRVDEVGRMLTGLIRSN